MISGFFDKIDLWFIKVLSSIIVNFMEGIVNNIEKVIDFASGQVVETPENFLGGIPYDQIIASNTGVISTVVMPIAMGIFSIIVTYELISLLISKNSLQDVDYTVIFIWMIKVAIGAYILLNAPDIINAIFAIGASMATGSIGAIPPIDFDPVEMYDALVAGGSSGQLIGLMFLTFFTSLAMKVLSIVMGIAVLGRMIESLLLMVASPIPMSTFASSKHSSIGENYLKNLASIALQGFLIVAILGIYTAIISAQFTNIIDAINNDNSPTWQITLVLIYGGVVAQMMFKTREVAKLMVGAS